jgi:DNA ligase D-like protein (predicted 3'-phosphoesterase)
MPGKEKLTEYRAKRDFGRTSEPKGGRRRAAKPVPPGRKRGRRPRFVIQQHQARSLHYDFRLEAGGVLKSWAVPKGPSLNPSDKRLAMPTEDHPLEYRDFEGVIPQGEYGAGTVIVWDRGTYRNLGEEPVEEQVANGHVAIWLDGKKLRGGYALTRLGGGKRERWLLVKMDDEGADRRRKPVKSQPESVKSGRTLEEVAARA